jgi:hypothetical protein
MNFANACIICCVATLFVISSVKANFKLETCLVQYLQTKGKLSADFPSAEPAPPDCDFETQLFIHVIKASVFNSIEDEIPNAASCLIKQVDDNKEVVDYIVKINLLATSRSVNESERPTQVEATRNQLKEDLAKIATHCLTDYKQFINIFIDLRLGLKNDSLTVLQHDYCLAKYAVDNQLVEFGEVEINPRHIDLDSFNCEQILEADRNKSAKYFNDANAETFKGEEAMNCAVNVYKNDRIYDWRVALLVIKNLDFSVETKRVETAKLNDIMRKFAARSISVCSQNSQE